MANFEASTTDQSPAICVGDVTLPISDKEAKRLGVDASMSCMEVAEKLDLPLYCVRALMEVTSSANAGTSMEDALWNNEGKLNYLNLSYLEPTQVKDTLPVRYYLAVRSYDPATGKELEHWIVEEESEIPILPKLAEKVYTLPSGVSTNGFQVKEVKAELYDTGVYFTATLLAPQGMQLDDEAMLQLYSSAIKDENGEDFPSGILYSELNTLQWPLIRIAQAASLEEIPERMMVVGFILE